MEAIKQKIGVKSVYDLSATPFFLKGSGYADGVLFPWVVSDFSLIDAIEAGIVKVPRVPVADDSMTGEQPTYRDLWINIRDDLPKKNRRLAKLDGAPQLPAKLEGAIRSLYQHYEKDYQRWAQNTDDLWSAGIHPRFPFSPNSASSNSENGPRVGASLDSNGGENKAAMNRRTPNGSPPVFIVVCNNTSVSKLVFDFIAGWEKELPDGSKVLVPGQLPIFSNVDRDQWTSRPNTIPTRPAST